MSLQSSRSLSSPLWPPANHQSLSVQEREAYVDEADVFYADPKLFIQKFFPDPPLRKGWGNENTSRSPTKPTATKTWPDRLIVFEQLEKAGLHEWIGGEESQYKVCKRFFNSHFHDDWRRVGDVVVYCRDDKA